MAAKTKWTKREVKEVNAAIWAAWYEHGITLGAGGSYLVPRTWHALARATECVNADLLGAALRGVMRASTVQKLRRLGLPDACGPMPAVRVPATVPQQPELTAVTLAQLRGAGWDL